MYLSLCACVCVSPHAHSHTRPHTHTHTLSLSLFLSVIERGKRQTKRRTFISTLEPREHFTRKLLKSKHPRASTRGKKKSLWDNHNKTQQARRTDERQQASTPPLIPLASLGRCACLDDTACTFGGMQHECLQGEPVGNNTKKDGRRL